MTLAFVLATTLMSRKIFGGLNRGELAKLVGVNSRLLKGRLQRHRGSFLRFLVSFFGRLFIFRFVAEGKPFADGWSPPQVKMTSTLSAEVVS